MDVKGLKNAMSSGLELVTVLAPYLGPQVGLAVELAGALKRVGEVALERAIDARTVYETEDKETIERVLKKLDEEVERLDSLVRAS
jgi:K+/H+ antiporter YhaU regulatory subunit KhtT